MNASIPENGPVPPPRALLYWPGAVAVVLLALGLRLAGMRGESLWWDEFASTMFLDAPTLGDFLARNHSVDPATLPFYFTLEYWWWHHVCASIYSLRVLSALMGAATAGVLFLFGRRLGGGLAGLVAALCFAVSPIQIHHGQSVRMYVLFVLLAALSSWSLLELVRRPSFLRWVAVAVCTFAFSWTHPFALMLTFAQGLFLLASRPWPFWRSVLWGAVSGLAVLPVAAYLSSVRYFPQQASSKWMQLPDPSGFVADVLGDDVLKFTYQLRVSGWGEGPRVDMLLLLLSTLLIAALLSVYGHTLRRLFSQSPERARREERQTLRYLWFWLVAPPTVLLVVSWFMRPCIFPRYTAHCALAAYLMAGMAAATSPKLWQRWSIALLLPVLIAAQWGMTLAVPQRTDWRGAARSILRNGRPEEPILVLGQTWAGLFRYNQRLDPATAAMPNPVAGAETEEALARAAAFALRQHPDRALWVVASSGYFTDAPSEALETRLAQYGLAFAGRMLPSIETLWAYRVTGVPTADPLATAGGGAPDLDHFVAQAFGNLGAAYAAAGDKDAALAALDALMQKSRFAGKVYGNLAAAIRAGAPPDAKLKAIRALWDGYGYRDNGHPREALQAFDEACLADDELAIAWAEQGLAGIECFGSAPWYPYVNPVEALARAAALDSEYAKTFARLIEVLRDASQGNAAQSLTAVKAYQEGQLALGRGENDKARDALQRAVTADPRTLVAYPPLAYTKTLLGDLDGALQTIESYRKQGGAPDAGVSGNIAVIRLLKGDPAGAEASVREAYQLDAGLEKLYGGLFDRIFHGDRASALSEAERLLSAGTPVPPPVMNWLRQTPSS